MAQPDRERRSGWQLAEHTGEARLEGLQRLPVGAGWEVDAIRDDLQGRCWNISSDPRSVLAIDERGLLNPGPRSVGVKRHYSGTAGRIENCLIGRLLPSAAPEGQVLLEREWNASGTRAL